MADKDASCSPDQNAARPDGRYGEHTARSGASFRCGTYGEVAAMVKLLRSGEAADMGPPLGPQRQAANGVIIDYWLGSTCWMAVNAERWARIEAVLSAERPDPGALHTIHWELAPFWCPQCQACYCRDDWRRTVIFDGPFYDCTDGECPAGHHHMIDD